MSYRSRRALAASSVLLLALAAHTAPALAQPDGQTAPAVANFKSCAKPVYPAAAIADKREGSVALAFLIGADGKVQDSKVNKSSGHADLDEAAREGIAKCQFSPALQDGKAAAEWVDVKYVWVLK